jgi:hypothetical protein
MKRGTTRLVDASTGRMECEVCGMVWWASIRPLSNGNYYRGSWQCPEKNHHPATEVTA